MLQVLSARRRPGNGVGTSGDGGEDALARLATGGHDGHFGMTCADACDHLCRACTCGNVEDGGAGHDLVVNVLVICQHCCHHGNIDDPHSALHRLGTGGGVEHDARRALHLRHHGKFHNARACGGAAADAHENGLLGHGKQGLRDDRLAGKGIDGEDSIGIAVTDNRHVGRVGKRLDIAPFDGDAWANRHFFGNTCDRGRQTAFDAHAGSVALDLERRRVLLGGIGAARAEEGLQPGVDA